MARAPTDQQLAAIGLSRADYSEDDEEVVEVWPENVPVYNLWHIVGDQWRSGPGGIFSLDLLPVFHELDRQGLEREEYDAMLTGIKTMAAVALEAIHADKD